MKRITKLIKKFTVGKLKKIIKRKIFTAGNRTSHNY